MHKSLTREEFNSQVMERDHNKCVICGSVKDLAVHHIMDRSLFPDGGYLKNNGATLCPQCHILAENGTYSCEKLRKKSNINEIILPESFDPQLSYDKWGTKIEEDNLLKYPRTQHVMGSSIQKDDSDETAKWNDLKDKFIVLEEKIDGANTGVSFNKDCELMLQCRGHYLKSKGDWPEFDPFKKWARTWKDDLFDILTDRYIMYGEWMAGLHSVFYDNLPHLFIEFDIYDKKDKVFLSTLRRQSLLSKSVVPISSVKVLESKIFDSLEEIKSHVGISYFISENALNTLREEMTSKRYPQDEQNLLLLLNKERLMEGLYLKWEENGVVKGRYKYVRPEFVQTILSGETHWKDRPTIYNRLAEGADMYAYRN